MQALVLPARGPLAWDRSVPGDKSISHRALMLGAVAQGTTEVSNLAPGADVRSTASCLRALGVPIEVEGGSVRVTGRGAKALRRSNAPLDCGNSGTSIRLLAGLLGGAGVPFELTGDESLLGRPMRRICEPLRRMGMRLNAREARGEDFPPLVSDEPRRLQGGRFELAAPSGQVKSALLLAGLFAEGSTEVVEPSPSRDHTERMLPAFGAPPQVSADGRLRIDGGAELRATSIDVPGDFSSAAFVLGAAALVAGSRAIVRDVGLNPGRTGLLDVLRRMGAAVRVESSRVVCGEPRGDVVIEQAPLRGTEVRGSEVPSLLDELPLVAVLGAFAAGKTLVRGAAELRAKESDRIRAVIAGMRAMGADAEELPDGFCVRGSGRLHGGEIDSARDHRIAMAFAVAALGADRPTTIRGAEWAAISFPTFWSMLGAQTS